VTTPPVSRGSVDLDHEPGAEATADAGRPAGRWTCTRLTGPDAGGQAVLGPGRYLVGRGPTVEVRCDDPALEAHHAMLDIADGGVTVTQLLGRTSIHVDGQAADGSTHHPNGCEIEIGGSVLAVERGDLGPRPLGAHIRHRSLARSPRQVPEWVPPTLTAPGQKAVKAKGPGGLIISLVGLVGAVVIALVMRQPMFLIFGALSGVVGIGSWIGGKTGAMRRFRKDRTAHAAAVAAAQQAMAEARQRYIEHHRQVTTTPVSARAAIGHLSASLWERRAVHGDAFTVSLGVGDVLWQPPEVVDDDGFGGHSSRSSVDAALALFGDTQPGVGDMGRMVVLPELPTPVVIGPERRLAVKGLTAKTRGVARSLILQLAANCGPADVRIIVVTHEPAEWRCLRGLPHATGADGTLMVVDESGLSEVLTQLEVGGDEQQAAHLVVVTDAPELLSSRTSPLRRLATSERRPALIALVPPDSGVPHLCTGLLHITGSRYARWILDTTASSLPQQVSVAGVGVAATAAACAALSELRDPEDPLSAASSMPRELRLIDLLTSANADAVQPEAIAAAWLAGGPNPPPRTPLGVAVDGVVDIDLVRDGPHALLAGTTGAGKSELLRSLVAGLAAQSSPDHLTFVLVDYKGGATFDACERLPHVVGVVTDLDDHLADRALRSLHAELRHRERLLREHGAGDLDEFRRKSPSAVLPRLVVVIDEFAALVSEQSDFLHALVGIAQRGRSLGVHLLLATQRPNGVISDDIRANTNLRIALRLQDNSDAIDVVGDPSPAQLPRSVPGRAVMRLGPDEYVTFQTARCTAGDDMAVIVSAICAASDLVGTRPPRQPWLAPLPAELSVESLASGLSVALVDDPDQQSQHDLEWAPGNGHLLLAGSTGAGLTTALVMLGARSLAERHPNTHLYVIDALGDDALRVFERSPRCAGVVRLHERERMMRALLRLSAEVQRRAANGGRASGDPHVLVLIDGIDVLRRALDDVDTTAEFDALSEVVATGGAVGVTVVMTTTLPTAVPMAMVAACNERWVFHLTDAMDAHALGVAVSDVPRGTPGRFRIASNGLEGQLARRDVSFPACIADAAPAPVQCLPTLVDSSQLGHGGAADGVLALPVGLAFATGGTARLELPEGEHVMVIGPPRSGRSSTLSRLAHAWLAVHGESGFVGVVAPRRTTIDVGIRFTGVAELMGALPCERPVLVVVDDAELVDDAGGALAALAAERKPHVTIAVAGKPDALRQTYGHWSTVVRRSRIGIVAAGSSDLDGDLVGALLPRRLPVPPRPGLSYLVDNGALTLVQVALDPASCRAGADALS
jgi:DNA segregation ATPase FtsK/SpoIIIE, S-DNA-T family